MSDSQPPAGVPKSGGSLPYILGFLVFALMVGGLVWWKMKQPTPQPVAIPKPPPTQEEVPVNAPPPPPKIDDVPDAGGDAGSGKVAVGGALVYLAGLAVAATAADALGLMLGFGALVGLSMAGVTFVVVLGAVGRAVPPEKRTLAFGIVTAGGSFGQFLVVPAAQGLLDALDWRLTLLVMGGLVALIIPLALGLAGKPPAPAARDGLPLKGAQRYRQVGVERARARRGERHLPAREVAREAALAGPHAVDRRHQR